MTEAPIHLVFKHGKNERNEKWHYDSQKHPTAGYLRWNMWTEKEFDGGFDKCGQWQETIENDTVNGERWAEVWRRNDDDYWQRKGQNYKRFLRNEGNKIDAVLIKQMSSELRDNQSRIVSESTRKWNDGKAVQRRFADFGNGRRMLTESGGKKLAKGHSEMPNPDFMQSHDDFATLQEYLQRTDDALEAGYER
jgi:hypothetical protein